MLAYSISSHVRFAPFTLPVILPSLRAAGIPPECIFVCVCGARRDRMLKTALGTLSFREHESKVYAAFIEALAWPAFNWWFVLMDTCKAGSKFGELSRGIDKSADVMMSSKAHWDPTRIPAELGAYRQQFLEAQRKYIMGLVDIGLETEKGEPDYNEGKLCSLAARRGLYGTGECQKDMTPRDVYGAGTKRTEWYFPALDLWKYQSNWGQERPRWKNQHDTP